MNQDESPPSLFSFGGGRQSTAALVLAARGEINFDHFVFSDVGDDSENPETVRYVQDVAIPFAAKHNISFQVVRWTRRKQGPTTLLEYCFEQKRSIPLPVSFPGTGPTNRTCTIRFKIDPVARLHKSMGATAQRPGVLGLGISFDEVDRMRTRCRHPWQIPSYPLVDLRLTAAQCVELVTDAGLPTPPNSACWFCPYQTRAMWKRRAETHPDLIEGALALEETLSARSERLGKGPCHLSVHGRLMGLLAQQELFGVDGSVGCDSGACWT